MSRPCLRTLLSFVVVLLLLTPVATAQMAYEWKKLCDLSDARHCFAVAKISEDKILVTGGFVNSMDQLDGVATRSCEIVNVSSSTSEPFPQMNDGRAEHLMLVRADGAIFVIGGREEYSELGSNSIETYDATTRTWRRVGSLLTGRRQLAGLFIDEYRILSVGGRIDASIVVNNAEIFDTRTGVSVEVQPYPVNIATGCAAIIAGTPCVFSGRTGGPNSGRSQEVWSYQNGVWRLFATLEEAVVAPSIVELPSGEVVVTCGALTEEPFIPSTMIQIISDSNVSRRIGSALRGRQWHGAALLRRSDVVLVGGYQSGVEITSSAESVNLSTGAVTELPPIPEPRTYVQLVSCDIQPGGIRRGTVVAVSGLAQTGFRLRNTPSVYYLREYCKEPPINLLEPRSFRLAGMAAVTEDGVRLTPSTGTAVGRMSSVIPLGKPSFEMSVGVRLSRGTDNGFLDGGPQGADGIAVIFSTGIDRTYLGRIGEGIGYDGLPNVVAVEVDAYRNPGMYDRDAQHVAIMVPVQGVTSSRHDEKTTVVMKPLPFDLIADGSVYDFDVSYNGSTLNVFASSANSGTRLVVSATSFDIYERLGVSRSTPIYASITAATGKSMQEHTIVRWNLEGCDLITSVEDDDIMPVMPFDSSARSLVYDALSKEIVVVSGVSSDITVFDLTGQIVLRRASDHAEQRIDVSILPRGFYVVSSGTTSMSFIVHD